MLLYDYHNYTVLFEEDEKSKNNMPISEYRFSYLHDELAKANTLTEQTDEHVEYPWKSGVDKINQYFGSHKNSIKIKSIPFTKPTYKFLNSEHIKTLGDLANADMSKLIKSRNMTQDIYHELIELKKDLKL